jgi:hypothetical protein
VGSGGAAKKSTNAIVLFRLIATEEENSKKSALADNITRFQNTQNPVRESDFFSNEPFQLWLSTNLPQRLSNRGAVPGFYYQHKRGFKPTSKTGEVLTLEKLAQLRHAIYYGPTVNYNSPRLFWDVSEPYYWEAFGVAGKECTAWDDSQLADIGLALTIYLQLIAEAKSLGAKARKEAIRIEKSRYLGYLSRYLTAALMHVMFDLRIQGRLPSISDVIASKTNYAQYCKPLITEMRKALMVMMNDTYGKEGNSRLAVARDGKSFDSLVTQTLQMINSGLISID